MSYFKTFLYVILWYCCSFGCVAAYGQTEMMFSAGSSHFLGDLGGKPFRGTNDISDINIASTRWALGISNRYILSRQIALRSGIIVGKVSGDDQYTKNPERRSRNAHFFSPIVEGNIIMEFYLNKSGRKNIRCCGGPFVFAGMGMFYFEPKTTWNGQVVPLRRLGTEGQYYRDDLHPYKNYSFSIPFGLGYRIPLRNGSFLGFELNTRKTFTDYIDDVSSTYPDKGKLLQSNGKMAVALSDRSNSTIPGFSDPGAIRGNPNNNDTYFFLFITYSHPIAETTRIGIFQRKSMTRGAFLKKRNKCFEF
jgi:hypothetical protein